MIRNHSREFFGWYDRFFVEIRIFSNCFFATWQYYYGCYCEGCKVPRSSLLVCRGDWASGIQKTGCLKRMLRHPQNACFGMQRTHACIFARFTRKMHGNDFLKLSGNWWFLRIEDHYYLLFLIWVPIIARVVVLWVILVLAVIIGNSAWNRI